MTGVTIEESQDNEWNQTMRGAKINWANPPTVRNGLVPGHHPCEHQAPQPLPCVSGRRDFPTCYHPTKPHLARQKLEYVIVLQHFYNISLCVLEFIFFFKKFYLNMAQKSKLYKSTLGNVTFLCPYPPLSPPSL